MEKTIREAVQRALQDVYVEDGTRLMHNQVVEDVVKEVLATRAAPAAQPVTIAASPSHPDPELQKDLVAQPLLYSRLMEMSAIIREGGRWDGNEFAYADKSESDISMLDDILGDALRLAAEPPAPHPVQQQEQGDERQIKELLALHRTYNAFDQEDWPLRFAKAVLAAAPTAAAGQERDPDATLTITESGYNLSCPAYIRRKLAVGEYGLYLAPASAKPVAHVDAQRAPVPGRRYCGTQPRRAK